MYLVLLLGVTAWRGQLWLRQCRQAKRPTKLPHLPLLLGLARARSLLYNTYDLDCPIAGMNAMLDTRKTRRLTDRRHLARVAQCKLGHPGRIVLSSSVSLREPTAWIAMLRFWRKTVRRLAGILLLEKGPATFTAEILLSVRACVRACVLGKNTVHVTTSCLWWSSRLCGCSY